ncbi:acyltransferase domain-containing protein [Herbihabitans rhizosphaerae]|nr:acyltransferase domain-containing protein [Herbihabitans rhizosphaerae]
MTSVAERQRTLLLSAASTAELLEALENPGTQGNSAHPSGPRLGLPDPTPDRIALARKVVAKGRPWRGRKDVWFTPSPLRHSGGKVAFLFPGLEGEFAPRIDDVAALLDVPVPDLSTRTIGRFGGAVMAVGRLLDTALRRMAITPDAVAGHSIGEWTAMIAGGIVAAEDFDQMLEHTDLDALRAPGVEFAVLGCGLDRVTAELETRPTVAVSHENSTNQTVVCGPSEDVAELVEHLRGRAVICQTLPFRSGFHTQMLRPYLASWANGLPSLPMRRAAVPVWSATTATPFPGDEEAARELCLRHLLEPVRFRTLVQSLYDDDVRLFVQAGPGQLGSLIDDTLGRAEHLTVAANSVHRSGIDALRYAATALWVEGCAPDLSALEFASAPVRNDPALSTLDALAGEFPAAAELSALMTETADAFAAVVAAARGVSTVERLTVSTTAMPYLLDHCLAAQRHGWPDETDLRPVVPATTMVEHLADAVERASAGSTVTEMRDVRFHRWLVAAPATDVDVEVRWQGTVAQARLGDHAEAEVVTAPAHPPAPEAWPVPDDERVPEITPERLYGERWMFHGPTFRGVTAALGISSRTIRGRITVPPAPGALLDNVGHLIGQWLVEMQPDRWIAFPVRMGSIRWYASEPKHGSTVDCTIRVTSIDKDSILVDAQVIDRGRVLVEIEGWEDRRFDGDAHVGAAHRFPGAHALSRPRPGGWWLVEDRWPSLAARELFMNHYLGAAERAEYEECPATRRRGWLLERIAAKDAVRGWLWERDPESVFPAELRVTQDGTRYRVTGMYGRDVPNLHVAVSGDGNVRAAIARAETVVGQGNQEER